jgi:predicted regulator of Ras-like GTPase activity (Roadblock/LC7/MglB family)
MFKFLYIFVNVMSLNSDQFVIEVENLIQKFMEENSAILGLSVGTPGGDLIGSNFKKEFKLPAQEIIAGASSLMFLSSNLSKQLLNQRVNYNTTIGKSEILISILTRNVILSAVLNRELTELEGLTLYEEKLLEFGVKLSAFVETSKYIQQDIFVAIKRAIPTALSVAIITTSGLPIKIESVMPESMLSAVSSALYNLTNVLLKNTVEYSVIRCEIGSVIIHQIDSERILCVAIPEKRNEQIGHYIARIKEIISEFKKPP